MSQTDRDDQQPTDERAVYIISIAAEMAGVHPQTLRFYEKKGLLSPARSRGTQRRYSDRDIARMRAIQHLTQVEGLNLAGAKIVMEMQAQVEEMQRRLEEMRAELRHTQRRESTGTGLVPLRDIVDLMPWQEGLVR